MQAAFRALDAKLDRRSHLVVGGGAAMALAYHYPLATNDVDGFAAKGGLSIAELDHLAKAVARDLGLPPDWLNAHFTTFTHVLPSDYGSRLRNVFRGSLLRVDALGPEDLLIMKCFAGRDKDRGHARALMRLPIDLNVIDAHLDELVEKRIPGAERAADFFDDLRDELGR